MKLDEFESRLLNEFQRDLPVTPQPFAAVAAALGVDEGTVIEALRRLQQNGVVSRVGPVIRPHSVGTSTLAAMSVPPDRLQQVADLISEYPQVNHNYEREHHFNLWFVITALDEDAMTEVIVDIAERCGLDVLTLPMLDDFYIDLGFDLEAPPR